MSLAAETGSHSPVAWRYHSMSQLRWLKKRPFVSVCHCYSVMTGSQLLIGCLGHCISVIDQSQHVCVCRILGLFKRGRCWKFEKGL